MARQTLSTYAGLSSIDPVGDRRQLMTQRTTRAARDFQASAIASLLKPLAPALMGQGMGKSNPEYSQEFFGFIMIEHLARQMADNDVLRMQSRLEQTLQRGSENSISDGAIR